MNLADVPEDLCPPDYEGERDFYRAIAAGVIQQAIEDLQLYPPASQTQKYKIEAMTDTFTALDFLFGKGDLCGGWAGVLGIEPQALRRGIVRALERQRETPATPKLTAKGAERKRRGARVALQRIAEFVQERA